MNIYVRILIGLLTVVGLASCDKFSLLTDVKVEHNPAGKDLLNKTIWEFLSEDNFHASDSSNIGLYGKAVQHAGLVDLFNQADANLTVIIPRNNSLQTFIKSIGYGSIEEIPSMVLRNLLLNTVIDTRVKSYDLQIGETRSYPSLSGDSLSLRRTASQYDEYIFTINASPFSNSPSTGVRTQNLEFKNGIGHVVDNFTYYIAKIDFPDPVDDSVVGSLTDTIPVLKDTYIQGGNSKKTNFGTAVETYSKLYPTSGNNVHYSRRILVQYPVRQPAFNDQIGSVKLEAYYHNISGSAYLNFYEDEYVDFNEYTVNWENAPSAGVTPLAGFEVSTSMKNTWRKIDITSTYISALNDGKSFINIGGAIAADHTVGFRTKEFDNGKLKSRIIIYSPVESILSPENINPIEVNLRERVKTIHLTELKFKGTEDKNISYVVASLPEKGCLLINSLPASLNSSFTQEQIDKGVIKYIYNGTGAGFDTFVLKAKDYRGGIYHDAVEISVNIR